VRSIVSDYLHVCSNQQCVTYSSFSGEEPASVEQLLQVLRYLRSERNAAISNAEALSLQKAELQAQLDSVQKQVEIVCFEILTNRLIILI
jgi:hypothetical protein